MKIKYIIFLIIPFLNFSCSKNCVLNYEIVGTEYEIPFYREQNSMTKEFDKIDYDRYELVNVNESEIPYIMEILNSQIPENKKATENIINNLCNYSVQIAGIYDRYEKTKEIYLNFEYGYVDYEEINSSGEIRIDVDRNEAKFNHVNDGGDNYFQAVINTKTNKIYIIYINGEA